MDVLLAIGADAFDVARGAEDAQFARDVVGARADDVRQQQRQATVVVQPPDVDEAVAVLPPELLPGVGHLRIPLKIPPPKKKEPFDGSAIPFHSIDLLAVLKNLASAPLSLSLL